METIEQEVTDYRAIEEKARELLKQAETLRKQERHGELLKVKRTIAEWGFTANELGIGAGAATPARGKTGPRGPVAPKYRNPETGETWTGRGQPPKWLAAKLKEGGSKEEYKIAA